jgi:hypothetical protein
VSTQDPAQFVFGLVHPVLHVPLSQTWPAVQAVPQPPQWVGSVCVSTQRPEQSVSLPLQPHVPVLQVSPTAQVFPQPPQFSGSVFVSTHCAPQLVVPARQLAAQMPLEQTSPVLQA